MKNVSIIELGTSNLFSIKNALDKVGAKTKIISSKKEMKMPLFW